jgi:hypothetical protein
MRQDKLRELVLVQLHGNDVVIWLGGYPVRDQDVAHLSPLIYDHINVLGRYSFAVPESVARGELRPLRNPADDDA